MAKKIESTGLIYFNADKFMKQDFPDEAKNGDHV
jgi:hypothetical protein